MGRRVQGEAKREKLVAIRLNPAEASELEEKRAHRGLDNSNYFRTLMKEDTGAVSSL